MHRIYRVVTKKTPQGGWSRKKNPKIKKGRFLSVNKIICSICMFRVMQLFNAIMDILGPVYCSKMNAQIIVLEEELEEQEEHEEHEEQEEQEGQRGSRVRRRRMPAPHRHSTPRNAGGAGCTHGMQNAHTGSRAHARNARCTHGMLAPHCTAPHRTPPNRTAPHRTAPSGTALRRTAPPRTSLPQAYPDRIISKTNYATSSNAITPYPCIPR